MAIFTNAHGRSNGYVKNWCLQNCRHAENNSHLLIFIKEFEVDSGADFFHSPITLPSSSYRNHQTQTEDIRTSCC